MSRPTARKMARRASRRIARAGRDARRMGQLNGYLVRRLDASERACKALVEAAEADARGRSDVAEVQLPAPAAD